MKHIQKKQQRGIAALAALLVIIIFAIMGITVANKAKNNEKLVGADIRYGAVFEAGEQTLRRVVRYLNAIPGGIKEGNGTVGDTGKNSQKDWVKNFDITKMGKHDFQDDGVFVWSTEAFANEVCNNCDFAAEVDADFWREKAVPSDFFNTSTVSGKNYLKNIRTYTFVEEVLEPTNSINSVAGSEDGGFPGAASTGVSATKKFYLITIKSSGYPPGTPNEQKTADKAKENVIIQSMFVKF